MADMENMLKTLSDQMQEIADDFCDNYCKYPDMHKGDENMDWAFEKDSPCDKCPCNRLI